MADDDIIYIGTVTQENARRLRPRRPIRYFEVDNDTDEDSQDVIEIPVDAVVQPEPIAMVQVQQPEEVPIEVAAVQQQDDDDDEDEEDEEDDDEDEEVDNDTIDTFDMLNELFPTAVLNSHALVVEMTNNGYRIYQAPREDNNANDDDDDDSANEIDDSVNEIDDNDSGSDEEESDAVVAEKFRCRICRTKTCSVIMIPCGHVYCRGCLRRWRKRRCATCRSGIRKKQRIYA